MRPISPVHTAAFQLGGALGAAVVTTVVVAQTAGPERLVALTEGFQAGFLTCVAFAVAGTALCLVLLRRPAARSGP